MSLRQSSTNPIAAKPPVTTSTSQTNWLVRSASSKVASTSDERMSTPPMVGVPALVRCRSGPSGRIVLADLGGGQLADQPGAEQERHDERGERGHHGAEADVAEDVEPGERRVQRVEQRVQHHAAPAAASSSATTSAMRAP